MTTRRPGPGPLAAAALTGINALYLTLVVVGNVFDFDTNREFVQHVLAMDTTSQDPDLMGRAIGSRRVRDAVYVAIIGWEALAALVLVWATGLWGLGMRHGAFARARWASTVGLVLVLSLFGGGFLAIGGEWFAMWQSEDWNGLDAALRAVVLAGLALLVAQSPHRAPAPATEAPPPR
ncbi:DUF2165 domain-containing protein [Streptomyces sp. NPDC057702]|uniref:DUF2165 domain-containing protein n=1 Tax=unclassified Streptomyces TaxID=2593676 RepID=UPI0036CC4495